MSVIELLRKGLNLLLLSFGVSAPASKAGAQQPSSAKPAAKPEPEKL